tara:strand:+ start:294 stop:515 length:222 start_codon:yes stop_codon:yes gene_type:complete
MIKVGDRVFYYEDNCKCAGFGLVIDEVRESEKYKITKSHIKKNNLNVQIFLILKDNGQLEEFVEVDLKKVVDF